MFRRTAPVFITIVALFAVVATACGGSSDSGVRAVSADDFADILEDPPVDLVLLDVRTPAEYDDGHIAGAQIIDFYEPDFRDRLAELDRDLPYLIYCRSGNRSGDTADIMEQLGFTDVTDLDGGVGSWLNAGQPLIGS